MLTRMVLLVTVIAVAGCGSSDPTPAAAPPSKEKLAPEAEYDPETAAKMYKDKKNKKTR